MRIRTTLYLSALLGLSPAAAPGRGLGDLIVYDRRPSDGHEFVLRFSPRLELLSATDMDGAGVQTLNGVAQRIARDPPGGAWIDDAPLSDTKLRHLDANGNILPSIELGQNPLNVGYSSIGSLFVTNRIGLSSPGPLLRVEPGGTITWSSPAPFWFTWIPPPAEVVWTSQGELWIGGTTLGAPTSINSAPMLKRIDPGSGHIQQTYYPPASGATVFPNLGTIFGQLAGSIDGTMWCSTIAGFGAAHIYRTNGESTLDAVPIPGQANSQLMRVDGAGDVWTVSKSNAEGAYSSRLHRLGTASGPGGTVLDTIDLGGTVIGFALGSSGRDLFATIGVGFPPALPPFPYYLLRVNLLTKAMSRYRLDPIWDDHDFPWGDPNGFILANVILRDADSDGDGHANGVETGARSDPFDPLSRPSGPRVDLWFDPLTNALRLRYVDPDGLLDPAGGIDPYSLSLTAGGVGEILPAMLNFLTSVSIAADGKEATLEFDALPIPSNLKVQLDAKVRDRTGAECWDWQVTPPGDL